MKNVLWLMIVTMSLCAAGSREGDSLALVAIKEANPDSRLEWNTSEVLSNWEGVIITHNRVDTLYLSYEEISVLPSEIGDLTELLSLNIVVSNIITIPNEIGELKKLTNLSFSGNQISTIPNEIGELKKLTNLSFSDNQISTIPATIKNLRNLELLSLDGNQITKIPPEIEGLQSLTYLELGNNLITEIPIQIGELTALTGLSLNSNKIAELPDEIWKLSNLTWIRLQDNLIVEVSHKIKNLTKLNRLNIGENCLIMLPDEIVNLQPVDSLGIQNNFLYTDNLTGVVVNWLNTYAPEWTTQKEVSELSDSLALLAIDITNNDAVLNWNYDDSYKIWDGIIHDDFLNDIIEINLPNKNIKSIPNLISTFTRLTVLNLSDNEIDSLPKTMGSFQYLRDINLSNNNLIVLPEEIIGLNPTNGLDVSYNDLKDIYMTDEMIAWLDTYDPDWRDTQGEEKVAVTTTAVLSTRPTVQLFGNSLQITIPSASVATVNIYNLRGQAVVSGQKVHLTSGSAAMSLSSITSPGIYVAKIESTGGVAVQKFSIEQ
ncbi:MAG: T9SS type A sorting domain-containing protein [Colwellia sp.]|nr:T9SS type A sorting domain-containing protein [Colwellia sp.]